MPKFAIPFLPLRIGYTVLKTSVNQFVSKEVEKKGFHSFKTKELSLIFRPSLIFEIHYSKKEGNKTIDYNDFFWFDTTDFTIEKSKITFSQILKDATNYDLNKDEFPGVKLKVLKPTSSKSSLLEIARERISELLSLEKEQIFILKEQMFYVPVWSGLININSKQTHNELFEVRFNAYSKELIYSEIPNRNKTNNELFSEVVFDLLKPAKWASHLNSISPRSKKFKSELPVLIFLLIILLLLAILFFVVK